MIEIWKDIQDYEGKYQVSNFGRVRNQKKIILKYFVERYASIRLFKKGKHKTFRIHQLVAQYFISNPENKPEVNHKDTNKLNNSSDNLEWTTRKENQNHALINGLLMQGENHSNSKLKIKDVLSIRKEYDGKHGSQKRLAEKYGVSHKLIWKVVHRKLWTHI